jgi:SET domain-containing protein
MSDLHNQWPHRWLSPKAEARTSAIQGMGIFAKSKVAKGETLSVLGGVIVHIDEIKTYRETMGHIGLQIDTQFFIVPTTRAELPIKGTVNHSCAPNTGLSNSITFVALREIEPGEECTFDYATSETYFTPFACHCGAAECRGMITPDDWKLKHLQEKYGEYYSPYLKAQLTS